MRSVSHSQEVPVLFREALPGVRLTRHRDILLWSRLREFYLGFPMGNAMLCQLFLAGHLSSHAPKTILNLEL